MAEIAPSILAADFARLDEAVKAVERGGAAIIHVDVMDGHFVPNITMGLPIVRSLARVTRLPLDAHLMIAEPARYVAQFAEAGARMISVHVEAETHLHRTLMEIKRHGALAGVAINPATPLVLLEEALHYADYVVLMAVNPGFSGQAFIPTTIDKLRRLRHMIAERRAQTRIEVDGGIELENVAEVAAAGADIIVAATAVFDSADPADAVRKLREATVQWV